MLYCDMPTRKAPPDDELIQMYEAGMSSPEIAEKFDMVPSAISARLRKAGCRMRTASEAAARRKEAGRMGELGNAWRGKKQPAEMVARRTAKTTGPRNGRWKHGRASRMYRGVIAKEECAACGRKDNLCIHHKDFDHYNNAEENLEVLCVSCHLSLHKKEYHAARRERREPLKSNAPVGWARKGNETGIVLE